MLKNIRVVLAVIIFGLTCLLFVGMGNAAAVKFSFLAKIQLVPAILAGSFITVTILTVMTLLFGRIYCSVICPLGILQDVIGRFAKPGRFKYRKNHYVLRYGVLALFVIALLAGLPLIFGLLEPYSAFGRMATALLGPIWQAGHNGLAWLAGRADSFLFAASPIWLKGAAAFGAALITLLVITVLALLYGRLWCNTICPVGTALGFLNRFALIRPRIAASACTHCGRCAKVCKASCIDVRKGAIDDSRCVACFNCLKACKKQAISYRPLRLEPGHATSQQPDAARRSFVLAGLGTAAALPLIKAAPAWAVDEEIPALTRKSPSRAAIPVLPPGAQNRAAFSQRCSACQLCVTACKNQVLSSRDLGLGMLQPSMYFARGYCRPNCVACSEVCPTGAIKPLTVAAKSALQIGRAVVVMESCHLALGEVCTTCSRNCPAAAINIVTGPDGRQYPAVNHETCTGCGACEYFCPARPLTAIRVEGNFEHRRI